MEPAADLAAQLARLPSRDAYLEATGQLLQTLFPSEVVAWNVLDTKAYHAEVVTFPELPSISPDVFLELYGDHPLVVSYLCGPCGADIRRMSDLVTEIELHETRTYQEAFRPLGFDRQFSIPTARPKPTAVRAWAMSRSGRDFSDNEMFMAHSVQPVLSLLDRVYTAGAEHDSLSVDAYSLTAREQEILQLLGKGLTGVAVGHLLGVSPRTVAKHLEHAYFKLGCTNRIDALRRLRGE